jgi:hypothetical protein
VVVVVVVREQISFGVLRVVLVLFIFIILSLECLALDQLVCLVLRRTLVRLVLRASRVKWGLDNLVRLALPEVLPIREHKDQRVV